MIRAAPVGRVAEGKTEATKPSRQRILELLTFGDPKLDQQSRELELLSEKTAACRGYLREQVVEVIRRCG